MDPLDAIFAHLDRWRHLPAYQLERRADIFFSAYLKGVIEEATNVPLEDEILPELPIKCDLIRPDRLTEQSVKVDYALFAKDRSRVFFVELKTDSASRRDVQDDYLKAAQELRFRAVVEGIRSILLKTESQQKYYHLAHALQRLGYLELPADLASYVYPVRRHGLTARLREIVVGPRDSEIEVIYVQPKATEGNRCVDFEQFAKYVSRFSDPVSVHFARHLGIWRDDAGARAPSEWGP
jgi:hypothetical protein